MDFKAKVDRLMHELADVAKDYRAEGHKVGLLLSPHQ
jgi:hypothetical protein